MCMRSLTGNHPNFKQHLHQLNLIIRIYLFFISHIYSSMIQLFYRHVFYLSMFKSTDCPHHFGRTSVHIELNTTAIKLSLPLLTIIRSSATPFWYIRSFVQKDFLKNRLCHLYCDLSTSFQMIYLFHIEEIILAQLHANPCRSRDTLLSFVLLTSAVIYVPV